jgi:perosamine synthetase
LGVYANMFNINPMDFPGAFACDQYSMSIPLHNRMVAEDYAYVVEILNRLK